MAKPKISAEENNSKLQSLTAEVHRAFIFSETDES